VSPLPWPVVDVMVSLLPPPLVLGESGVEDRQRGQGRMRVRTAGQEWVKVAAAIHLRQQERLLSPKWP
jgi:hypothetical protein